MLSLAAAPTLASTPGLAGAGGPLVRAPRRHNVSALRRLHPLTQDYLDRVRAVGPEVGILSSAAVEQRALVDRWVRGVHQIAGWDTVNAMWTLRASQSAGTGSVAPALVDGLSATLVNGPTWSSAGVVTDRSMSQGVKSDQAVTISCAEGFTIMWCGRVDHVATHSIVIMVGPNGTGGCNLVFAGGYVVGWFNDGDAWRGTSSFSVSAGTWHSAAVIVTASTVRLAWDGTVTGTTALTSTPSDTSTYMYIGRAVVGSPASASNAAGIVLRRAITSSEWAEWRALYRATLGAGLP